MSRQIVADGFRYGHNAGEQTHTFCPIAGLHLAIAPSLAYVHLRGDHNKRLHEVLNQLSSTLP